MRTVAAIDLGATSGRVITGTISDGVLAVRDVARFPNVPVRLPDGLHWDALHLYARAMSGLGEASRREDTLVGAAVDAWAVDYGLLRGNHLLGDPYHYRDDRNAAGVAAVHRVVGPEELFRTNGLQHLPFNTVFQLAVSLAEGELAPADRMLLIPDLIGFWATGTQVAERTNASTTGLVPVGGADWDLALADRIGVPRTLLPPIAEPGTRIGGVTAAMRTAFGITPGVEFTLVGSHDTASAVVGVPLDTDDGVYISCGTWSLVGAELPTPIATDEARKAGFTNEGGVDGRIRLLKNVMGLWVLSETLRAWEQAGEAHELGTLLKRAAAVHDEVPTFDANDTRLLAPDDMPARIAALIGERGARAPTGAAEFVRSVLQSLAEAYADAVRDIGQLTGRTVRQVHLVGGGSRNALLCQLTADTVGLPVAAGPVEATAIGNLLVQARTHGLVDGDLDALRDVIRRSFPPRMYLPRPDSKRG